MKEDKELERSDIKIGSDLEINTDEETITAYVETWFDVDAKFGTHVLENDNEWLNSYAEYHPKTGELKMMYQVNRDGNSDFFDYTPSANEKALVVALMEEQCQKDGGCSLKELYEKCGDNMTMGGI